MAAKDTGLTREQRRLETARRWRRLRRRKSAEEQAAFSDERPVRFHDVLVIGPTGAQADDEMYRVPVVKTPGFDAHGEPEVPGSYPDPPEKLDLYDYSLRKTLSVARPHDWSGVTRPSVPRGPAFGTLPVKREPAATTFFTCCLLDAQNFTHRNAWTAEEWNDIGGVDLPPAPSADDPEFEVLIAGPRGKVFLLRVNLEESERELWKIGQCEEFSGSRGSIECLDLRHETETWHQLRNGTVVGRVLSYRKAQRDGKPLELSQTVPLVNITSLIPEDGTMAAQDPQAQPHLEIVPNAIESRAPATKIDFEGDES